MTNWSWKRQVADRLGLALDKAPGLRRTTLESFHLALLELDCILYTYSCYIGTLAPLTRPHDIKWDALSFASVPSRMKGWIRPCHQSKLKSILETAIDCCLGSAHRLETQHQLFWVLRQFRGIAFYLTGWAVDQEIQNFLRNDLTLKKFCLSFGHSKNCLWKPSCTQMGSLQAPSTPY